MSETTPSTSTPSAATSAPHAEIARRVQNDIDESVDVAAAAQLPAYATILHDDYEIDAQNVTALAQKSAQAQQLAAQILAARRAGHVDTTTAQTDKVHLLNALDRVQTGAHLKFDKLTDEAQKRRELQRYFVGTNLGQVSKSRLETIADAILLELASETLPSVKPAQVQALRDALAASRAETGPADPDAQALYEQLLALIEAMKPLRRAIQIAANSAFSFRDTTQAAARRAFHLPAKQPFV